MSMFNCFDIRDLAKVLKDSDPNRQEESSDDDEDAQKSGKAFCPSDIGLRKQDCKRSDQVKPSGDEPSAIKPKSKPVNESSSIWSQAELKLNVDGDDVGPDVSNDPRQVPSYEMYFRQSVSTEDIFLQMGHKTPATASCENLIVKITLPNEKHELMQLDLKKQRVELRSPLYILILPLPHPIDPRAGDAKWNKDNETLILTLKLNREMDMFNF